MTGYRLEGQGSIPSRGKFYLFSKYGSGVHPASSIQWVSGEVPPMVKQQGREADHAFMA
jgi:hypothetical protein